MACPCRIYVESDPFLSQIKVFQGDAAATRMLASHHLHFSFGEKNFLSSEFCQRQVCYLKIFVHVFLCFFL